MKKKEKVRMPRQNGNIKPAKSWKRGEPRPIISEKEIAKLSVTPGVRIRPVKCGKARCNRLHFIYAYARVYEGGKRKEKYIGRAPVVHH